MNQNDLRENLMMWFTKNRQGEEEETPCFWRLFQVRSLGGQISNKTPALALNFEVETAEDSVELLMDNLSIFTHIKYMCIRFMKAKNDNNYLVHSFINPFFDVNSDMTSINGIQNQNQNSIGLIMELIKDKNDDKFLFLQNTYTQQIEALKNDFEKKQEIKELKAEIESIKTNNTSVIKEILTELKEPLVNLAAVFLQSKVQPQELPQQLPQEIPQQLPQESQKYKDLEPFLNLIDSEYGTENLKAFLGEFLLLYRKDKAQFLEIRKNLNLKINEIINKSNE